MNEQITSSMNNGQYGPQYTMFYHMPKEAIRFLKRMQQGECIAALSRDDIGDIDIVWGENDVNNKGYGLKHIIEKHGESIRSLGFEVEDFIPIVIQYGTFDEERSTDQKRVYSNNYFRFVIAVQQTEDGKKQWLLTSFDIKHSPQKKQRT